MSMGRIFDRTCRGVWLLVAGLTVTGCAATADFVKLTKEVTYVRGQQKELKAEMTELKSLVSALSASQKSGRPEHLASRLDELSAKLKSMATEQSISESALIGLRQDHEKGMRRIGSTVTGEMTGVVSNTTASDSGVSTPPCAADDTPEMEPNLQSFVSSGGATQDQTDLSPREAFEIAYQDYQAGDYESAIEGFLAFQKRFPKAPLVVDAQYLVGTSYFRTRDCARATAAYEKMVSDFPHHKNNALALLKLASLYDATGNTAEARSALLLLIERHPRAKEAKLARQRLPEVSH